MAPAPKTPEDKAKLIAELKQRVASYLPDETWTSDGYLYKWIEAKSYSVDKAEKALRKTMKWRLENNVDGILEEDFEDMLGQFVYYMDGHDKEGRIVVTTPCNLCNVRGLIDSGSKERLLRFLLQLTEQGGAQIRELCLRHPEKPSSVVSIIDFEGVDMTKMKPDEMTLWTGNHGSIEDHYPGQTELCIIINASKGVKNMFKFMRATLPKNTSKRLQVFGTKRHKWEPAILAMIDADQLRPRFGGTKPDTTTAEVQDLRFDMSKLKMKDIKKEIKELKKMKEFQNIIVKD